MDDRYFYIDPRGRRSGPFSEAELRRMAATGLLEREGSLELAEIGGVIRLADTRWLRDSFPIEPGEMRAEPAATASTGAPTPSERIPTPPPDAIAQAFSSRPAATAWVPPLPAPQSTTNPATPATELAMNTGMERSSYVLLGILPSIAGIFGIHNVVAGYIGRGITQLVLSLFTLGGCFATFVGTPCLCLSIPLWIALFAWTLAEVTLVRVDARGRRFA
jgi:hypothetical protein